MNRGKTIKTIKLQFKAKSGEIDDLVSNITSCKCLRIWMSTPIRSVNKMIAPMAFVQKLCKNCEYTKFSKNDENMLSQIVVIQTAFS